ncbi:hypothetical protein TNCV_3177431 [Trichonephila clavipes]|nr:hypothetical protein TNCV_3177431 [Trichonephila clavipes]
MSSSLESLKTRLAEGATHVKSVEAGTSSRWCGVEVRRRGYQFRCRPLTMGAPEWTKISILVPIIQKVLKISGLEGSLPDTELAVFQHKIQHISRSYRNFGKWFLNPGLLSRHAPTKPLSHPVLWKGVLLHRVSVEILRTALSGNLPECFKTDHRFLSGATDYTRVSISEGPVVQGPPFGWFRKRVKFWLYPATTGKLSEIF